MDNSDKKNYSPSADRNKDPILEILRLYIDEGRLLEVGSGTGQHAVYFAKAISTVQWVTSDIKRNHSSIEEYLVEAKLKNVHGPEALKIGEDDFPRGRFDYLFTANTLHIMPWKEVKTFIKLAGKRLRETALVFIYGPFNYEGKFTSDSNEKFNASLKEKNPDSGIRNFEDILSNMQSSGFALINDHEMPANNRLLVFERLEFNKN